MKRRQHDLNSSDFKVTTKWKVPYMCPSQLPTLMKEQISSPDTMQNENNDITSQDFISLLAQRNMEMIVEIILSHLDENSLRSCELVSTSWYSVIQSSRLWKKLYRQGSQKNKLLQALLNKELMGSKTPVVRDNLLFKKLLNTHNHIQQIWKTGKFTTTSIDLQAEVSSFHQMDSKRFFLISKEKQVIGSESSYLIMVFNRWTLKSECVLKVPENPGVIIGLELHEELIFCAHASGNIVVWDLTSQDIVMQFQAQDIPDGLQTELIQMSHIHAALGLFITCSNYGVDTYMSLRLIHSPAPANTSLKMVVESTENIPNTRVLKIESDVKYFILLLLSQSNEWSRVQFRSTTDFCIIRQLDIDCHLFLPNNEYFAYHSGRLVTSTRVESGYLIKVWDVETLTCIKKWLNPNVAQIFLTSSHLILNHYFCCTLSVLELPVLADIGDSRRKKVLKKKQLKHDVLFHYKFKDELNLASISAFFLRVCSADELQIFFVKNAPPYMLTVVNFLKNRS